MAINQINELQLEIERLNGIIAKLTSDLQATSEQNELTRELYTKERDKRLGTLAQASEAMAQLKSLQEELKASTSRAKIHEAEERADKAEEEMVTLQVELEKEVAIKQDVIAQLRNITSLTENARATRKLIENKNKQIHNLDKSNKRGEALALAQQGEIQKLENKLVETKEELETAWGTVDNLMEQLEKVESQGWINDTAIIFRNFGVDYGAELEEKERYSLYGAVYKAKKLDKSNNKKKQEKAKTEGFDVLVDKCVKDIQDTRSTKAGKATITKEFVIGLIKEAIVEPKLFKTFSKKPLALKIRDVAVTLGIVGLVLVAVLVPTTLKVQVDKLMTHMQNSISISQEYDARLVTNLENLGIVLERTGSDTSDIQEYVDVIMNNNELASNIAAYNENGDLVGGALGVASAEFYDAAGKLNVSKAQQKNSDVGSLAQQMGSYADESDEALASILQARGMSPTELDEGYEYYKENKDEIDKAVDMLTNQEINVEFSENDVAVWSSDLISHQVGYKGTAVKVGFAEYRRDTGKVTLGVECEAKSGKPYINIISFTMESGRNTLTVNDMMEVLTSLSPSAVNSTAAYAGSKVTDAQDHSGYFNTRSSYDAETNQTTVETSMIVVLNGDMVVLRETKNVKGQVADVNEIAAELIESLTRDANNHYGTGFDVDVENA